MVIAGGLGELSGKRRVGQRVRGGAGLALEDFVERGQDEEREERRAGEAADDDGGERLLDFAAGALGEEHRDEAEGSTLAVMSTGRRRKAEPWITASATAMPSRRSSLK